ncbi:SDR family NAD(P)-dependent oxidoreductase [Paenibacillus sp. FA6]|uniref:SDR family NAD(P)-dependent oxidoreductase n=1 Tax=Paenibacillus sp. FA6 TaxID=3413029 RepID=UPI003F657AAD
MTRKTALIVGDTTPLNRAIALALATLDYNIAIAYRTDKEQATSLLLDVEHTGVRCYTYPESLEDSSAAERATARAFADTGRLDLLVWNAGIACANRLVDTEAAQMDLVYRLNYRSGVLFAKAAANQMIETGIPGSILFLTSIHGLRAYETNGLYGSFAAALHRSAESLAMQLAPHGIRFNCIAPGIVASSPHNHPELGSRIPLGMGTPEDIANTVVYLASDKASYITGTTLRVDGGLTLPGMPEYGIGNGWSTPHAAPGIE